MGAFLHNGRAFAVVFTHNDQSATGYTARGEVGQGVGGHVGAYGGFPGYGPANGVHHGSRQRGGGRGFRGASFEVDVEFFEDILRVGQHVH